MAIAFHAAADLGNNGGSSNSLTVSYTCGSGSNRFLVVAFAGDVIGGNDDITGVTYGGAAMTLAVKQTAGNGAHNRYLYIYILLAPASGANNVVISCTSSHYLLAVAADYTGALQSSQPDATATNTGTSSFSITTSLTTVANNCWTFLFAPNDFAGGTGPTAGAGSTLRATETAFGIFGIFDSNGAITPAGSTSMTATEGGGGTSVLTSAMISFSPDTGGGVTVTVPWPFMRGLRVH